MRPTTQQLLDIALARATDAERARFRELLTGENTADTLVDVDRHDFLHAAALAAAAVVVGSHRQVAAKVAVPPRVGPDEIGRIHTAAAVFTSMDHTYGGGLVREAVATQVAYAEGLLTSRCAPKYRRELFAAVGFLAHAGAFMAFDSYHHADARRMFALALSCAEAAGDWDLCAKVLSSRARQAIWCRDPEGGLTDIARAPERADRLTATERAMLYTAQARACAKQGLVQDTLTAVGHADDAFTHASLANDPTWMAYYDLAQHHGDTGHALYDLAVHGHCITAARTRLTAAVAGHGDLFKRSRGISATKLASLLMLTGDPAEAAAIGTNAVTDLSNLRSRLAADDLRELQILTAHTRTSEVTALSNRIDTVLAHT
ncbi:XRE family transcriptional regulator [Nocardia terpenica]|uniref:XRE family transcriptional regulator n=1 Tax=Nocardia terpenica TaxID=455432 RepID=UPI0002EE0E30|nr:XRE family transcriptional regulator [Nocardia terpenica]NQE86210.1 XRE family transcriptional regulator [Nocardia terpenica]